MLLLAEVPLVEAVVLIFAIAAGLLPVSVVGWCVFFYWFLRRRQRAATCKRRGGVKR